jgi:hypothetical protein
MFCQLNFKHTKQIESIQFGFKAEIQFDLKVLKTQISIQQIRKI